MENDLNPAPEARDIWTVSRLNLEAQGQLEGSFPLLWLEGEISNLSRPASGHMYFSLKDDRAQVSAAMFRGRNQRLRFQPANGTQVLVRARVTLYVPRGNFQLVIEHMEEAGEGRLRREFERLREKLREEGLFEQERKRPLPAMPAQIGLITSASGAALRDILHVLERRCPGIPVLIYPSAVQGNDAPAQLKRALALANARGECDVLIMGRGGGSLEDLWAFNDEQLARDIAASHIPVVSAVGHEVDVTLADFVADLRAPTPSAAAELVGPDLSLWQRRLEQSHQRLVQQIRQTLTRQQEQLHHLRRRLPQPQRLLQQAAQQVDELEGRLQRQIQQQQAAQQQRLEYLKKRLAQAAPQARLALLQQRLNSLQRRLPLPVRQQQSELQNRVAQLSQRLHLASPLQTLARGYSITFHGQEALTSVTDIKAGDRIRTRVADGELFSTVDQRQALSVSGKDND